LHLVYLFFYFIPSIFAFFHLLLVLF